MPHTSSAKKHMRQTEKRRMYNRAIKKQIKGQIKEFMEIVKAGTPDQRKEVLRKTIKRIDSAAAKKVIHLNTAARKKSQLARIVNEKNAG